MLTFTEAEVRDAVGEVMKDWVTPCPIEEIIAKLKENHYGSKAPQHPNPA